MNYASPSTTQAPQLPNYTHTLRVVRTSKRTVASHPARLESKRLQSMQEAVAWFAPGF